MTEGEHALPPDTMVAERYRVVGALGRGGMGTVYEAVNVVTGKPVALKMLSASVRTPEVRRRLLREAQLAARVHHPHVIDIYDVGFDGDTMFLVMELLRGRPLDVWLTDRAPVSVAELLVLTQQTLRGLAALHSQGIVHRDVKPSNVFVGEVANEPPRAKLLDLGIARDRRTDTTTLTGPTQIVGTPAYMAPEQLEHPDRVDARTDVYAFGVLIYEALAGERPFIADSLTALLTKILTGRATPLTERRSDLPEGLSGVVARAMNLEPSERFADASALAEALAPFASTEASPPSGAGPPVRVGTPPWAVALFVVTLLAVAAVMLATLGSDPGARAPVRSNAADSSPPIAGSSPADHDAPASELARGRDPAEDAGPTRTDGALRSAPRRGAEDPIARTPSSVEADRRRRPERSAPRARVPAAEVPAPEVPATQEPPRGDPRPARPGYLNLDPDDF